MSKLIKAGLRRYFTSVLFWVASIAVFLLARFAREELLAYGSMDTTRILFVFFIYVILFGWNIGREYEEGIFKNKIIAGHSKAKIFFSEMILAYIVSSIMFLIFAVVFLVKFMYVAELMEVNVSIRICISFFLINLSMVSFIVTISMLLSHRGLSIMMNIIVVLGFVICVTVVGSILSEEKYVRIAEYKTIEEIDEYGNVDIYRQEIEGSEKMVYNIDYVGGMKRKAYEFVYNTMPAGQVVENFAFLSNYMDYRYYNYIVLPMMARGEYKIEEISKKDNYSLNVNIAFSIGVMCFLNLLGSSVFRKVELK